VFLNNFPSRLVATFLSINVQEHLLLGNHSSMNQVLNSCSTQWLLLEEEEEIVFK